MRRVVRLRPSQIILFPLLVAALLLTGCGTFVGALGQTPTPVYDTTTVAGYRKATEARGNQINAAMAALHAGCSKGVIADCTRALDSAETAIIEPEDLIRTTVAPQGCTTLASGYNGLLSNASTYRYNISQALTTEDTTQVARADARGWRNWTQVWGNNNVALTSDRCR